MERRRKALGFKRSSSPEKSSTKPPKKHSTAGESSKSNSGDNITLRDKGSHKSQPAGSVTPTQKNVLSRSNVTPLKSESPSSPLQSPGCQMMFPGTLASPEIEVSWDWSCSQVPNDMLPPKTMTRKQDAKKQRPVLPTISIRPRPRLPLQRQITEEENQQRLEFYKNILSSKSSESSPKVLHDATNNNVENTLLDVTKINTTPKRPTTRLSSSSTKKRDEDSLFFDDSANEFMIECSQAIEEKLKNGEIDMGPIVDIKISQAKRPHSPGTDNASLQKKSCHGRVNLFPDNSKQDSRHSRDKVGITNHIGPHMFQKPIAPNNNTQYPNYNLKKTEQSCMQDKTAASNGGMVSKASGGKTQPHKNSMIVNNTESNFVNNSSKTNTNSFGKPLNYLERRPLGNSVQSTSSELRNKDTNSSINKCTEKLETSLNIVNHSSVNKVPIHQSSNYNLYMDKIQSYLKPPDCGVSRSNMRNQQNLQSQEHCTSSWDNKVQKPKLNSTKQDDSSDIKSLLDDDFDFELSRLDVDSLCLQGENNKPEDKNVTAPAPKLCTREEIEAKRLAALQKLKMKKKR